jgi:UDP-glucose 4-epimerase
MGRPNFGRKVVYMSKVDSRRAILITGGMGFIGTAMVKRFSETDRVTVADRLDFGISEEVRNLIDGGQVELIEVDLSRPSPIYNRVADGEFDGIVNLAALTHIPLCEGHPEMAYGSNTIASLNLFASIPSRTKVVNFSTSSTYAPDTKLHVETSADLHPVDIYGLSKKHMEDLSHYYAKKNHVGMINIRLANAAGYGETNPKLLGTIFQQIHSGVDTVELGNLTPRRDFIHIDDIAWAIDQLLQVWPVVLGQVNIINLGTGHEPISVEEVFRKIAVASGRDITLKSTEERKRKIERELLCVDCTKLKTILPHYRPKKVDDWIGALANNPGIRIGVRLDHLVGACYD